MHIQKTLLSFSNRRPVKIIYYRRNPPKTAQSPNNKLKENPFVSMLVLCSGLRRLSLKTKGMSLTKSSIIGSYLNGTKIISSVTASHPIFMPQNVKIFIAITMEKIAIKKANHVVGVSKLVKFQSLLFSAGNLVNQKNGWYIVDKTH